MCKDNNLQFLDTNEERNIPADSKAVSKSDKTTERLRKTLHNCAERNKLTDTFTIDHLLSKLSSNKVAVFSCLSTVDKIGLPYYVKYLKPSLLVDKDYLYIPLCNGVHFQGYVINIKERKVVHVDCLRPNASDNPTAQMIAKILFDGDNVSFESAFKQPVQSKSNSCGVWMFSEMAYYVLGLLEVTRRDYSFDICESLVERKSNHLQVNETEARLKNPEIYSDKQIEKFNTVEFLYKCVIK